MTAKVLQINVGRAYAAQDMAYATAKQRKIDILIVSEPNKKRVSGVEWMKDTRGNVAVLCLTKNIGIMEHKAFDGYLTLTMKDYTIICCYISPNIDILEYEQEVDNIMDTANNKDVIILGDINAKSTYWGAPKSDKKGNYWLNWLSARDMIVLNKGTKPTFVRGQSESHIDVSLATNKIACRINNWEVLDTDTLTEHRYICFDISGTGAMKRTNLQKADANWETFRNTMEVLEAGVGDDSHYSCTRAIQQAYRSCREQRRPKGNNVYWWNDRIELKRQECTKLRRTLTRDAKRINRNPAQAENARTLYKSCKKELSKMIRDSKRKLWLDICEELDNNIWGDAYKIVVKRLSYLTPYELSMDRKKQIVSNLFSSDAHDWTDEPVETNLEPFGADELANAACSMKEGKAPGPDKIPPGAIKQAISATPVWILRVLNGLLATQTFPDEWKIARVVLILKSGKPPELAGSYRPLCMLNTLSKLMEALIKTRLEKELEEGGGLHPHQYGFRRGKSTVQALETVMETVHAYDRAWTVLITIDVRNAFNMARHDLIIQKLRSRHISGYLVNMVSSYLRNRKIQIGEGEVMAVGAGVPQGSVLGPTLWNVLYDEVLGLDLTRDATTIGFADDLALVVGAESSDLLVANANECLHRISTWMRDHSLVLAPEKTEAVILKGRRNRDYVSFNLDGETIGLRPSTKYLGVTVDDRGTFKKHVGAVAAKAESRVASLNRIMPNLGGPSSGKRAVLCSAMHNILLYGAPVWCGVLKYKKYRQILGRAQRGMLLRVASAYKTVSGNALQVITGIAPIDLLAAERQYGYNGGTEHRQLNREDAKERTLELWQSRWDGQTEKAQWTKRLIPKIKPWFQCKHRRLDYYLTQALTAHGAFRSFAKRIGKDGDDRCVYCSSPDTAEHTLFACRRWDSFRKEAYEKLGYTLTPETLTQKMIESETNWRHIHYMLREIMKRKETEELLRQKRERGVSN